MAEDKEPGALKRTLNTFFNPFAFKPGEYWSVTGGNDPFVDALGHAGSLGLGYASAAALVRSFINDIKKRDTEKLRRKVRSNIAASRPTITLDGGDVTEEELAAMEAELMQKEERLKEQLPSLINKYAEEQRGAFRDIPMFGEVDEQATQIPVDAGVTSVLKDLWQSAGVSHPWHLAAALGMMGLGTTLGYKATGNVYDRAEKAKLDKEIEKLRKEIDNKLYQEYITSREPAGTLKSASDEEDPGLTKKILYTGGSLYALYALLTGALAYNFARKYSDANDPNRQQLAQIEEFTKRRALSEKAPKFINLTSLGDGQGPEQLRKRKQLQTQSLKAAPITAPESAPTDVDDPVAALLNA